MTLNDLPKGDYRCSIEAERGIFLIEHLDDLGFIGYVGNYVDRIRENLKIIKIHDDKGFRGKYRS